MARSNTQDSPQEKGATSAGGRIGPVCRLIVLMVRDAQTKVPWDRRLTDRLARESWEVANDPARRSNPPFRQTIRSPYFWMSALVYLAGAAFWTFVKHGWGQGLGGVLYLGGFAGSVAAQRRVRTAELSRTTTDETSGVGENV